MPRATKRGLRVFHLEGVHPSLVRFQDSPLLPSVQFRPQRSPGFVVAQYTKRLPSVDPGLLVSFSASAPGHSSSGCLLSSSNGLHPGSSTTSAGYNFIFIIAKLDD